MAAPIYEYCGSLNNTRPTPTEKELEVSLSINDGIPLIWSANGKLTGITTSTDRPVFILNGDAATSSTGSSVNTSAIPPVYDQFTNGFNAKTGPAGNPSVKQLGGYATVLPVIRGFGIWRKTFTPLVASKTASTGGSTTSIVLPAIAAAYAANAFKGGTLYCHDTREQVQITASTQVVNPGDPVTLTIVSPLAKLSDGMVFSFTPLGRGMSGIRFSHVSSVAADGYVPSQLGVGSADWSGGFIEVVEVDILNGLVFITFI